MCPLSESNNVMNRSENAETLSSLHLMTDVSRLLVNNLFPSMKLCRAHLKGHFTLTETSLLPKRELTGFVKTQPYLNYTRISSFHTLFRME